MPLILSLLRIKMGLLLKLKNKRTSELKTDSAYVKQ